MDQIALLLSAALRTADAKTYDDLIANMTMYEDRFPAQMAVLLRSPAFSKLWTAIKEAT